MSECIDDDLDPLCDDRNNRSLQKAESARTKIEKIEARISPDGDLFHDAYYYRIESKDLYPAWESYPPSAFEHIFYLHKKYKEWPVVYYRLSDGVLRLATSEQLSACKGMNSLFDHLRRQHFPEKPLRQKAALPVHDLGVLVSHGWFVEHSIITVQDLLCFERDLIPPNPYGGYKGDHETLKNYIDHVLDCWGLARKRSLGYQEIQFLDLPPVVRKRVLNNFWTLDDLFEHSPKHMVENGLISFPDLREVMDSLACWRIPFEYYIPIRDILQIE